jgi:hypothetical protein
MGGSMAFFDGGLVTDTMSRRVGVDLVLCTPSLSESQSLRRRQFDALFGLVWPT